MKNEIKSIEKNKTLELMDLSKEKKNYLIEMSVQNKIYCEWKYPKHKARLVAKGYSQQ